MEQVKFCSYCAHCRLSPVYYVPECDDEEQDLFCKELNRVVYTGLCWNEIAGRHKRSDGIIDGLDKIPKDCPLFQKSGEVFVNPCKDTNKTGGDDFIKEEINTYAELFLTSPSNTYVVYDGTGKIQYQGDLAHCFSYYLVFKKWKGFDPIIYSKEGYDKMMKEIEESQSKH